MRKSFKICLLLLILSAVLLSGCAGSDSGKKPEGETVQKTESTAAPEEDPSSTQIVFEGQDTDGNTVSSSVFSGSKLTMVNVWATYCNPCLNEMPGLGELSSEYDSAEFQLIGIISDIQEGADQETIAVATDLIEQTGADYPHLLLNESLYNALLTDVTAVPTTFFIDENGVLLNTIVGSMEKSAWEETINALLESL